ncbi:hypothetical protein OH77DRAFT_888741 [Trametes cingulata]|nr:hypothetical protein OH77DRAFT_888741 [Trametes cingulata]
MFKRVAKRIRKKEREEELGLDGDMKEMLGMNDVDSDSDSSDSDSDDGDSDEEGPTRTRAAARGDEGEDEDEDAGNEEEDKEDDMDEDEDASEADIDGMEELEGEDESEEEEDDEGEAPMTVSEALQNPLYLVSLEPEVKQCIVCPGKLIKNPIMADVHLKSNAHTRRFARVRDAAMAVDADTDIRQVVRIALAPQGTRPNGPEGLSKRAQKKQSWRPSRQSARSRNS